MTRFVSSTLKRDVVLTNRASGRELGEGLPDYEGEFGIRAEELRGKAQTQLDAALGPSRSMVVITLNYQHPAGDMIVMDRPQAAQIVARVHLDPALWREWNDKAKVIVFSALGFDRGRGDTVNVDDALSVPALLAIPKDAQRVPVETDDVLQCLLLATLLLLPLGWKVHNIGTIRRP
jgi:hypothetical protein